jgi:SAM-dependent methyltransferase
MQGSVRVGLILLGLSIGARLTAGQPLLFPSEEKYTEEDALKVIQAGRETLSPVFAPLARQIVEDFSLADKTGIGIDLGAGPGNLIIELCRLTRLHWVNADINPHFFPHFFEAARAAGVGHRVSAIFADAQALPFRDNYAEVVVSRGSFQFWEDKRRAFSEIYRVLKPGAVAFVGRGFSPNLSPETAKRIRAAQEKSGSFPKYDLTQTESELRGVMEKNGISDYRIRIPKDPSGAGINYGIWVEFHKPGRPN